MSLWASLHVSLGFIKQGGGIEGLLLYDILIKYCKLP